MLMVTTSDWLMNSPGNIARPANERERTGPGDIVPDWMAAHCRDGYTSPSIKKSASRLAFFSSFTRRQIRKYDRSDRSALEPNPLAPSHLHLHPLPESYVAGDVLGGFEGRRVVPGRVFVDLAADLYVVVAGDALP